MEAIVVSRVESLAAAPARSVRRAPDPLRLRLLGPMAITRGDAALALPPSRKVRALVAYLALAPRAIARGPLTELLWDLPNDPLGELRWCLSKARALLDAPQRPRVLADAQGVRLDLEAGTVDALEVEAACAAGLHALPLPRLQALAALYTGEFLQGLDIDRSAPFSAWLLAQRRHSRARHAAILEQLVRALPVACDDAITALERWLHLAPFELRAHELLLDAFAQRGQWRDGEDHVAASARAHKAEQLDWSPIGRAWQAAKARHAALPAVLAGSDLAFTASSLDAAETLTPRGTVCAPAPPHTVPVSAAERVDPIEPARAPTRRASIVVMPFADRTRDGALRGGPADALAHDLITRLAQLRSLFVIAQGTVFALDEHRVGADDAARRLDVDYVATGSMRRERGSITVSVHLTDTRAGRVVWADVISARRGDTLAVLDEIGDRLVASISHQIELAERNRAVLKPPQSLDAWEAHHRGLWHMYRFNRDDNQRALHFFETAVRLDPTFARPYAGLSFTHFQNAFLGWGDREQEIDNAYRVASLGLMADDHDPAAHWAMGRALWLRGRLDESLAELDTSVAMSPNFALGHYTLAFVHAQAGDANAAIDASDRSRHLSPFDPLLFAMLASRALALIRLGRYDEAADCASQAIVRPNAHVHVLAIAAHCFALAGRDDDARRVMQTIRQRVGSYGLADFLAAFRFGDDGESLIRRGAARIGLQ